MSEFSYHQLDVAKQGGIAQQDQLLKKTLNTKRGDSSDEETEK